MTYTIDDYLRECARWDDEVADRKTIERRIRHWLSSEQQEHEASVARQQAKIKIPKWKKGE